MSQLPILPASRFGDDLNSQIPGFVYRYATVSVPTGNPTRVLTTNPKRFWVAITVVTGGVCWLYNDSTAAPSRGIQNNVGGQWNYYWSYHAPITIQEFWLATSTAGVTVFTQEGLCS